MNTVFPKLAFLLLFITSVLHAQNTGILKAKVIESGSDKAVPFAYVIVDGTQSGGVTDDNGVIEVKDIVPGTYNIKITCVGYQPKEVFEIEITRTKPAVINIELSPTAKELKEVEIKAKPFVRNEESPVSVRSFGINEIQRYPGGNRDISKVIQSLPGVGFTPGFRNDILIRGGGPGENRFYLDGIEIPNINHFATQGSGGGPNGLINVDFIREVNFYSGAFPSNRGNSLSSIMDIRLRDGRDDRFGTTFTLGSSDISLSMESPLNKKKTATVLGSVRYSYLQWLFKAIKLPFTPTYSDAQIKFKWKITPKDEVTILSLAACDLNRLNLKIKNPTEQQRYLLQILPEQNQWSYMMGLKYTHYFENSNLTVVLSRNMLINQFNKWMDNDKSKEKITDYRSNEAENKWRIEYSGRKNSLRYNVGWNYEFARYTNKSTFFDSRFVDTALIKVTQSNALNIHKFGAFASVSYSFLKDRVVAGLGIRFDGNNYNSSMMQFWNQASPRASLSIVLVDNLRLNLNTGYYHQLPAYTLLGYTDSTSALANKNRTTYMRNLHVVGGLEYTTPINSRISVEGFYKQYFDMPFMLDNRIALANQGAGFGVVGNGPASSTSAGRSYGMEVLYEQKLFKGFYGIVSYTLFWSQYKDAFDKYVSSSWDTRHIISLTAGKKFKRNWEIGGRVRVQGGSPYTPYDIDASTDISRYNPSNPGILDYNNVNSARAKWFHAMDLRVTKKWYLKKISLEVYLDVQNVYASKVPSPPSFIPVTDPTTGAPLMDVSNPGHIQYKLLNTSTGLALPAIGVVVTY